MVICALNKLVHENKARGERVSGFKLNRYPLEGLVWKPRASCLNHVPQKGHRKIPVYCRFLHILYIFHSVLISLYSVFFIVYNLFFTFPICRFLYIKARLDNPQTSCLTLYLRNRHRKIPFCCCFLYIRQNVRRLDCTSRNTVWPTGERLVSLAWKFSPLA